MRVRAFELKNQVVRTEKKARRKQRSQQKRRATAPSIFDRLLFDDVLNPPKKVVPKVNPTQELDLEDELASASREAKLRARRSTSREHKEALKTARKK